MPENGIIDTSHFNDSESFIDNTVSTTSSSPRANVIIDDEISKNDLALGEKVVVKKSSRYYEQLLADDGPKLNASPWCNPESLSTLPRCK